MKNNYIIVCINSGHENEYYLIEKRFLWVFWKSVDEFHVDVVGHGANVTMEFKTIEDCKKYIYSQGSGRKIIMYL